MPISSANQILALQPGTEVSEQESLKLTRNLLRIAMFNISYIRGLFPDSYFVDKYVPALEMKVKCLQSVDMESKRFIDWMEKGAFDALQKKYLRTLFLTICGRHDGPLEEEYIFSFKYASKEALGNATSMTIETITSNGQHSLTNTSNNPTPLHMRKSACKMVRTLVQLMHTLDNIPEERTIVMKLHYYDDVTPADYEPPFFTSNTGELDPTVWSREPLEMNVGHVDSNHYKLGIKIKTVCDPCQDEIDLGQNQSCSVLLVKSEFNSSSDSERSEKDTQRSQPSQPDVLAPASSDLMKVQAEGACQAGATHEDAAAALVEQLKNMTATEDAADVDSDKTEDAQYEAESLGAIRHYLLHSENSKVKMIEIFEKFPQLSMALIKGLVERLVEDDLLTKHSKNLYHIKRAQSGWKQTSTNFELNAAGDRAHGVTTRSHKEDRHKMVLFHTLRKDHISAALLRDVLPGASDYICRQHMLRMLREGFIENCKLNNGKIHIHTDCKVLHTPEADKKLQELSAYFGADVQTPMVKNIEQSSKVDMSQPPSILVQEVLHTELPKTCEESTHRIMVKDSGSEVTLQEVVGPDNSTGNLCKHIEDVNLKEMSLAFPTKDPSKKIQHQSQTSSALVPTPVQGKATDKLATAIDNSQLTPTIVNIVESHITMDNFGQYHGLPSRRKASKVDHPIYHDLPPGKRLRPE